MLRFAHFNFNVLDYYFDGAGSSWEDLVDNTGYSAHNDVYAFTVESVAADSSSAMMLVRLEGRVFEADLDETNDLPAEIDIFIYTVLVNYAYLLG